MSTFYVWVTVTSEAAAHAIVGELLDLGCTVSSLASDGELLIKGVVSQILGIQVASPKLENASALNDRISAIVKKRDMAIHGIVVYMKGGSGFSWSGSSIKLPLPVPRNRSAIERLMDAKDDE